MDRKHPEKAIYKPPHLRNSETESTTGRPNPRRGSRDQTTPLSSQTGAYKLEIEVAPKTWHKQMIDKVLRAN